MKVEKNKKYIYMYIFTFMAPKSQSKVDTHDILHYHKYVIKI